MEKYTQYLGAEVINEGNPVTYTLLAHELKVHVQQAKRALFAFHRDQNRTKPGSVHATYQLIGRRNRQLKSQVDGAVSQEQVDRDTVMQSSPPMSSLPEQEQEGGHAEPEEPKGTTIMLVQEEELEGAKTQFEYLKRMFVYSLEPTRLTDIQVLSECYRKIERNFMQEDPLKAYKNYGYAQNPNVWRRTKGRPPTPVAPVATTAAAKQAPRPDSTVTGDAEKPKLKTATSQDKSCSVTPQVDVAAVPPKSKDTKAARLEREKSNEKKRVGSIMSKLQGAKPKAKAIPVLSAEPSVGEDEPMKDAEEGEQEADFKTSNAEDPEYRKARKEREDRLRKMMEEEDDEDEEMNDALEPEAQPEENKLVDQQPEPEKEQAPVTVEGGKRRGRRRVMKKRTTKDEEGYLGKHIIVHVMIACC